jgi:hypothetical protein
LKGAFITTIVSIAPGWTSVPSSLSSTEGQVQQTHLQAVDTECSDVLHTDHQFLDVAATVTIVSIIPGRNSLIARPRSNAPDVLHVPQLSLDSAATNASGRLSFEAMQQLYHLRLGSAVHSSAVLDVAATTTASGIAPGYSHSIVEQCHKHFT